MADFNNLKNIKTMKKILLAVSAVALMFAGCTKDLTNEVVGSAAIERGAIVEKTLVFEDDTRLERDGVSGKLAWSEGDQIQVVLAGADGALALDTQKYTIDHVNGKVGIPENTAYVLYMPVTPKISGTTASFNLPYNVTNLASAEDIFDRNPMKGVIEGDVIAFQNLLGYIKVPVKGEGKLQSVHVRTICRTTSDFHPIAQAATLDLSKNVSEDGGVKMATNNSAYSYLKYTYKGGLDISAGEELYIALPEGEYENMSLTFVTDKGANAIYANNKHAVIRSTIKPISAEAIDLAAHTPANPVSLAGTTGKAYEDYARCYMVPPTAGSYEFPCILADGVVIKGAVTAEIKWAEEAGMVYDLHYDPATNKVSFKTNGKKGNALIVVTDGNMNNNSLIWHWHIWITDAPKTLKIMGSGSNANVAYYLMDRVIGATWTPSSNIETTSTVVLSEQNVAFNNTIAVENASDACGVYFQYQNCNPLPRVKSLGDKTKENIATLHNTRCGVAYGFSQYSQYWSTSSSAANIFKSTFTEEDQALYVHNGISLPSYQYRASEGNKDTWNLSNIINQQGKTSPTSILVSEGNYRLWNSINNNNHDEMMKYKTAHDPCPPGYITENYSVLYWYATTSNAVKAKFGYARAAEDDAVYKSGYKFYGMYYNGCKDKDGNDVPMYWPCAGNRTSGVTGVSGQYANCGYIYVVNTNNTNTYTVAKDDKTYTIGNGGAMAFGEVGNTYSAPGLLNPSPSKTVNSQGYNVRCRRGKF